MKLREMLGPVYSVSAAFLDVLAVKRRLLIKKTDNTQQPSTLATFSRDPSKDEEHFNRPIPSEASLPRSKEDWSLWSMTDILHVHAIRLRHKNSLGGPEGDDATGISVENRIHAVRSFFEAGNAHLTLSELDTLTKYYADNPDKDTVKAFEAIMERGRVLVKA